ncbi:hypothetical protein SARC_02001 [Sphaeroforma arctica JP610]|uniref:Oxidoreductase-like domain-containing protein n=1 Tax=Sphaeroforma arctica JP610 TaxID=667725 RepID=A0A0L0G9V9_9EUKA|nr:hypothetical protein SARC_02001 [Sphaeroforma arctica JP610]KNC85817.1 hypothetical protein SARC_02001 [Sphaeroforma arctica JP610]|eukprot:XP_014159719.1 hypothetical protein SARC_02001 [Sphaeroforma arctica JP610]
MVGQDFDPRDMCCMSGCAHCVLDDLYEEATKAEAEGKDVSKIDPAIKAFMDMEKKQKEKARLREEAKKLKEAQNEVPS